MPSRGKRSYDKSKKGDDISSLPAQAKECPREDTPYEELFETAPQAFSLWRLVHDQNGNLCDLRLCAANRLFREWFDLPNAVGKRLDDIDPSYHDRPPDVLGIASRVTSTEAVERHEFFHPRLGRWLEFKATSAPQGLLMLSADDITDRVEAESALRRVQYSLDHIDDYPAWTDAEGRIMEVSHSTCAHLEYSREELLNMTLFDICPDIDPESYRKSWEFRTDLEPFRLQVHHRTKSGRVYPVEVVVSPLTFDGKKYHCALCRDITERQEAERALRDSEDQLLQAQKMEAIGRLAGGIAHDFNNVLTTIVGYSDLLLSSPYCSEGSVTEDLTEIKKAAERAGELTQRILAFSRRQDMQPSLLSLNDVVVDTEKLLARTIGADIELTTSLASELGKVEVDEQQFVHVLLNLAVNARDAMPKGGKLTISTANVTLDEQFCDTHPEVSPGPHVMLTVEDTGAGMDEQVLLHVFEPFYTTKPPGLGTGLGLATAYGIIAQSGGCIYVHSRVERGTTFTIYLPRVTNDFETSDPTRPDRGSESALGVIMVVDSDAPYLALTTRFLERQGFKVLPVNDGEKAAKILADRSAQVNGLVTDLALSGALQGEQLAELAIRRRPTLRLLFVSSDGSKAKLAAKVSPSAAGHLEKPFTAEELHREVRTWVTGPDPASEGAG